ncbi:MAG: hypothetical protein PQ975_00100 [Methanobacterium sp.]|jgi:hypothetical protein
MGDDGNKPIRGLDSNMYNAVVLIAALIVLGVAFVSTRAGLTEANDVLALFSGLTSVIGIIIGAYFGINVGAAGKKEAVAAEAALKEDAMKKRESALEKRDNAIQAAQDLALLVTPDQIKSLTPETQQIFLKNFKQ